MAEAEAQQKLDEKLKKHAKKMRKKRGELEEHFTEKYDARLARARLRGRGCEEHRKLAAERLAKISASSLTNEILMAENEELKQEVCCRTVSYPQHHSHTLWVTNMCSPAHTLHTHSRMHRYATEQLSMRRRRSL